MSATPSQMSSAAFAAATSTPSPVQRRVSKSKLPANDIIPGPISPPGHPNFVQITKKTSTSSSSLKRGSSASSKVKATVAISDTGDDGTKSKSDLPQISVSITNKLVRAPSKKVKEAKKGGKGGEEEEEEKEKTTEPKEEEEADIDRVTEPKTVQEADPMDTGLSTEKAFEADELQTTFDLFHDPLLPTSADSLKAYFVDNVADSLSGIPQARALCEHMLALLKLGED